MKNWPAIDPERVGGKEPTELQLAVQHDLATITWSTIHVVSLGLLLCPQHGFSTRLLTKVACQNPHSLPRSAAWSCSHSLERQCFPKDLDDAMLVPIPKKVCLSNCDNWRGISLLDVVGKPIATILQDRLQQLSDEELPESQCGFCKGRGCTDMTLVVRQLVEKTWEHQTKAFFLFIDVRIKGLWLSTM